MTAKTNANKEVRLIGLALTTALAGITLSGCAHSAPAATASASKAEAALAKGKYQNAIQHAEAAVLAEPRNAAYRAMLGAAYLEAGRFASAATSFDDAMKLGDNSPRTALSLALALSADGKGREAVALLDDWRERNRRGRPRPRLFARRLSRQGHRRALQRDPQRREHRQDPPEPRLFLCPQRPVARSARDGRAGPRQRKGRRPDGRMGGRSAS